jgi:hypothetical protein
LAKDKKASVFILPAIALRREIKYLEISRKVWAINSLFHLSLVAKLSNGEKNRQKLQGESIAGSNTSLCSHSRVV